MSRVKRYEPAKGINSRRKIVLGVINAPEIIQRFHIVRHVTQGSKQLAFGHRVLSIEEEREAHELMCFSVLVVLGQQPLQRLARLLKTLSHKIAVGQKKLSWLRGWIAVQDAPRAPFGIVRPSRIAYEHLAPQRMRCATKRLTRSSFSRVGRSNSAPTLHPRES